MAEHRLVILNSVALNVGDAAILEGEHRALREAFGAAEILACDDAPAAAAQAAPHMRFVEGLSGGLRVPHRALRGLARSIHRRRVGLATALLPDRPQLARTLLNPTGRAQLDRLADASAAISTGGTYFVEHYSFAPRAHAVLAAQAVGIPTFLYTQSLGPFTRPQSRRLMKRVFDGCAGIFLRDERSRAHVLELGVDGARVHVRPDAAFTLARADVRPAAGRAPGEPVRIAISVRDWHFYRSGNRRAGSIAYARAVAGAIRELATSVELDVVFLSTCQGLPAYWTDDSVFAQRMVAELLADLPNVRVDRAFHAPEALRDRYGEFDLVVATRMHAAILALCAGVPVVPIAYEFKTRELFDGLGMGELVEGIDDITAVSLAARMRAAIERAGPLRRAIAERLPGLRAGASDPARMIHAHVTAGRAADG